MLTYKRKLILTKAQQSRIDSWIGCARTIHNLCLEIRIAAWRNKQQSVHKYELAGQLKDLKDIPWIADVPAQSLEEAVFRLDSAYQKFFNGAGFPKWASKRNYKSIKFRQDKNCLRVDGNTVKIPKIGSLKFFKDSIIYGNVKTAVIVKDITGYFVCITTDAIKDIQCKDENQVLGLDVGIVNLYFDSNGQYCQNPKIYKKYEAKLRVENRSLSRKKKGSNSWKKQAYKIAILHHKITNVRRDFLHKESTKIAKANHTVILEDLNVAAMSKSRLSKHILDVGWATFRTMLSYKTNVIAIDPKYTSQTCNSCGEKDKKSRVSQSKFVCTSCGVEENADFNASLNIKSKGIALVRQRSTIVQA